MSAVAFWNARKKQKRNPQVLFQLTDPETLVFKLKYIFGVDIFKKYESVGVRQYQIPSSKLQDVVDECDARGWEVVPFPDYVQKAMDISINIPFDESFKDTHLWNCMFGYQKEGVQKVISTFNGRALIGDEMGLGKTLQAISVYKYYKAKKLLVICPAYLRCTWKKELEKWVPGIVSSVIKTEKTHWMLSLP